MRIRLHRRSEVSQSLLGEQMVGMLGAICDWSTEKLLRDRAELHTPRSNFPLVLRNCTVLVIDAALCINPPWDLSAEASELWAALVSSTSPQAFASGYGVDGVAPSAEV